MGHAHIVHLKAALRGQTVGIQPCTEGGLGKSAVKTVILLQSRKVNIQLIKDGLQIICGGIIVPPLGHHLLGILQPGIPGQLSQLRGNLEGTHIAVQPLPADQIIKLIVRRVAVHIQDIITQLGLDSLSVLIHQFVQRHQIAVLNQLVGTRNPAGDPGQIHRLLGSQHLGIFLLVLRSGHTGDLHGGIGHIFL